MERVKTPTRQHQWLQTLAIFGHPTILWTSDAPLRHRLFIGSYANAVKPPEDVSLIVNCTVSWPFSCVRPALFLRLPMCDGDKDAFVPTFCSVMLVCKRIRFTLRHRGGCLIHCLFGASRSVFLSLFVLLYHCGQSITESMVWREYFAVQAKRKYINVRLGYLRAVYCMIKYEFPRCVEIQLTNGIEESGKEKA